MFFFEWEERNEPMRNRTVTGATAAKLKLRLALVERGVAADCNSQAVAMASGATEQLGGNDNS